MALIAKVTVVAMVNGVRSEFATGATLPDLAEHDVAALKAVGAIEDTAETDKAAKATAAADKSAGKEFAEARRKVQAEQASLTT